MRQHDLAAARLGGVHDLERGLGVVRLGQRLADLDALRQEERVGHAAADDQLVDLGGEVGEHVGILVDTLAPPITAAVGRCGFSSTRTSASISSIISGPA